MDHYYPANCAFGQPCPFGNPWASALKTDPPHFVWFQFNEPKFLTKIGFSSRHLAWWECQSPKKFDVVAAKDPQDCENFQEKSEVLLRIDDAGFQRENQDLAWAIAEEKQAWYHCIGIKIHSVIGRFSQTNSDACLVERDIMVAVHKIRMWEKRL